jgi:hypothetical protein
MSESQDKPKTSFVDPKNAPLIEKEKKTEPSPQIANTIMIEGKEIHVLKPDIAPTLIFGKLCAILDEMKFLNSAIKASAGKSESTVQPTAKQDSTMVGPQVVVAKPTEQTPRVKEILAALDPVKELLNIDVEDPMFVLVKPAQFLGPENFRNIAQIVRAIGGQYVSAGKNSHFEIPKAPLKK